MHRKSVSITSLAVVASVVLAFLVLGIGPRIGWVEEHLGLYPVNEVIIHLTRRYGRDVAEAIAADIGGKIVGEYPSVNAYRLKVPTKSSKELDNLIDGLRRDPRIAIVKKNTGLGPEYFAE